MLPKVSATTYHGKQSSYISFLKQSQNLRISLVAFRMCVVTAQLDENFVPLVIQSAEDPD